MFVERLKPKLLRASKRAFTTRRVKTRDMRTLISRDVQPKSGDLVLATVDELGSHQRVEHPNGRRARIFPGDAVLVCYGNRYAPDQFEAVVPDDLGPCDLVAGGGIAGRELCRHERMSEPTRILPIGIVGDKNGQPLNLAGYAVEPCPHAEKIPVVLVFGTAMNSGKTMTAGSLVRGFATAGVRVAGIKATGTGSGGDLWFMKDMGATHASDFLDIGLASTYLAPPQKIEDGVLNLIDNAAEAGCSVAVVEIADGLQHAETAALLESPRLRQRSCGVVFAAYDALGGQRGIQSLEALGHHVFALSGQITRSPLAMREIKSSVVVPVYSPIELQYGVLNEAIFAAADDTDEKVVQLIEGIKKRELSRVHHAPVTVIGSLAEAVQSPANGLGVGGHERFEFASDDDDESEVSDHMDSLAVANSALPLRAFR